MAEPLKASFGQEKVEYVADLIGAVFEFDRDEFVRLGADGFEDLELMARSQLIADALAHVLPRDRGRALTVIIDALAAEQDARLADRQVAETLVGVEAFRYLPLVQFVRDHGLAHFDAAMEAQHALTQVFTAEFSIRAFLEVHREATLARLAEWVNDPSEHVRRLVSEGTRPRLPWASRLAAFVDDPTAVVELLEQLRDDPSEYVRRSVANNINDISKDHPEVAIDIARRWWPNGASTEVEVNRRRLIRHGLRTLVKAGDPDALRVLGYGADSPVRIGERSIEPTTVAIGGAVRGTVELINDDDEAATVLVDFRVWYVKADGSTSPKVFKGAEIEVGAGGSEHVAKRISLRQMSTRTHHPGRHRIEVLVNGQATELGTFELLPAPDPA